MSKQTIAILRGGPSEEHAISLETGLEARKSLQVEYNVVVITIDRDGVWTLNKREISRDYLRQVDAVFLALHGSYGEDGCIQKQLDDLNVIYTGSGHLASKNAFDKARAKELLTAAPCMFASSQLITLGSLDKLKLLEISADGWFVKPNASGSSFGVELILDQSDLFDSVSKKVSEYEEVLVEERIVGTEITAGVVERMFDEDITALPLVEIIPPENTDFFNVDVKYNGETSEICPARINEELTNKVQQAALYAHKNLNLEQYSRSDFIINDSGVYYLETNTLPGLTPESLFPKEIAVAGSNFQELITHLVKDALLLKG